MSREQKLLIEMVMRQTSLTFDEIKERLEINNNNYMIVIKEALGIKPKLEPEIKTINQQIYTEIRGLMDNASDTYRKKKEYQEIEKQQQDIMDRKNLIYEQQMNKKLVSIDELSEI